MVYKFNNFSVSLFKNGLIKDITCGDVKVNLLTLSELDNPLFNVFVRHENNIVGLLNTDITKEIEILENAITYKGKLNNLEFCVSFIFGEHTYQIDVKTNVEVDVIYTQDIGIGAAGNTLYASQYIDNRVYDSEFGKVLLMRRTQKTATGFPLIQIGANKEIMKYATEGFDFFNKDYRKNKNVNQITLPNRERNYELAFCALEVENTKEVMFYANVAANVEQPITSYNDPKEFIKPLELGNLVEKIKFINTRINYINGEEYKPDSMIDPEYDNEGNLLAFYDNNHSHIVLPTKELKVDRHHANIITSKTGIDFDIDVLVSSNYMNGVFWAQNAIGNTQLNTYNKNLASYLDFNKLEGMRVFLSENGEYKQLNMPSYYEIGFNYSKWVYLYKGDEIVVTAHTSIDNTNLSFNLQATKNYDFIVTDTLNGNFELNNNVITPKNETLQLEKCKDITYVLETNTDINYGCEELNIDDCISMKFSSTNMVNINLLTAKNNVVNSINSFEEDKLKYKAHFDSLLNNYSFEIEGNEHDNINSFNHLLYWYLHNGLIHFATPHGVEQHGGAAWGTRDVCQGPVELFLSLGHYDIVRQILIKLFDNQFIEDGNWPQWFMFDEYDNIRPNESHGDIIAWPIKALSQYINVTGDLSILDEEAGFYHHDTMKRSEEVKTIFEHVQMEVNYITNNFIEGTYLSQYGEGDWDDTLQPANSTLRKQMVSGWTVPLTYQGFLQFSKLIGDYDQEYSNFMLNLANNIASDYRKYFIKDGVVSGFIYVNDLENIDYMLHPLDQKTGINYRLLPINESIIGGIFTNEETISHIDIIDKHLKCPDGVRLMNAPVKYDGGVEHVFQRGESASTVGREISLQYVHAHIRYIESMTVIKNGARAYEGLKVVSPFIITKAVPNAAIRQSNSYFSSSEGDINNRYEYAKEFEKLKTGEIAVRGGWRIYSSGPGIYLNQLLSNYIGIKFLSEGIMINTAIGAELDGLIVKLNYNNTDIEIKFSNEENSDLEYREIRDNAGLFIDKNNIKKIINIKI